MEQTYTSIRSNLCSVLMKWTEKQIAWWDVVRVCGEAKSIDVLYRTGGKHANI